MAATLGGADQDADRTNAGQPGRTFPALFQPLHIGGVRLANRIFSSGHDTVMSHDGAVTDQLVAYHQARAAGGVGLIVLQVVGVHQTARYTSHILMATDDRALGGFTRLAETIHAHGTKVFAQLFHPGREIMESQDGSAPVALGPSAVANERFRVIPRAMPTALIREVIDGFAQAAARLERSGLDGVEIVASHGYLPAQFLNPRVNVRTDAYGGDAAGRLRFLREVLEAARAAVSPSFVVGMRISVDELSTGGLTPDEVIDACRALDAAGLTDYISICGGSSATLAGSDHIVPPMTVAAGYLAPLAGRVKAAVSVPVLVAGRINQPQEAEAIIAAGLADACAMTRALIADPLLPVKAATGRAEQIRACIGCNQACIGHFHAGYPISCIQHPETGRELKYGTRRRAATPRSVLVVGGGPGGLKAAAVAAERGHTVTLYEAGRRLGGQILLARQLPGRAEFGGAADNLEREARAAGVRIVTDTAVDAALVDHVRPEVVIVATGATSYMPSLELTDDAMPVCSAADVVSGSVTLPSGRIVVADSRGDWVGVGVAELLARAGHRVTLTAAGYYAADRIQQYTRDAMLGAVARLRVETVPLAAIVGADDDTVYLEQVLTGEPIMIEGVAALVLSQGSAAADSLLLELQGAGIEAYGVGDCLAPRTVEEAVLEGLQVADRI